MQPSLVIQHLQGGEAAMTCVIPRAWDSPYFVLYSKLAHVPKAGSKLPVSPTGLPGGSP